MEHYIVSARKYRPSSFSTVVGQRALTAALKHAVATDRLAHAYLFCGSRGVGKTSCARIFAKTINCQHRTADGEACNECESCRSFNDGTSMNIIELDAASHNGVDDMKALIEQVLVPPTRGKYRVFIIDEVHMLSSSAFNAFLKTLEEPPEYVVFVLATTEKHKIIPTILSRCQIYDFNRITIRDMVEHLQYVAQNEGIQAEGAALSVIARKADGAMRDALSIFDQVAASSMGNVTYQNAIDNLNILDSAYYSRLVEAFLSCDVQQSLLIYKEVRDKGFDSQFFINGLGLYLRDLMLAMSPATLQLIEASDEERAQMAEVARKCQPQFIYKAMSLCNEADLNYRVATNKQFLIELTLVKLCQLCSPSPGIDGGEEGQLKPIAVASKPAAAPAPKAAPAAPATAPQVQPSGCVAEPQAQPANPAAAPQAQPTTHTYSAPAQQAAIHKISAKTREGRMPTTLSIRGLTQRTEEKATPQIPTQKRTAPYTIDDLHVSWDSFCKKHPTERIMVNTMLACKPVQVNGDKYTVSVQSTLQERELNEWKAAILTDLHDALLNDNFDFDVIVDTSAEESSITWNERQVLSHMVEEHPQLKDFIKDFGFTLG